MIQQSNTDIDYYHTDMNMRQGFFFSSSSFGVIFVQFPSLFLPTFDSLEYMLHLFGTLEIYGKAVFLFPGIN